MQHLPVNWHEGMFLRPQHFHAAERACTESFQTGEHWDHEFNYGLRAIEFSAEAIANFQFQINHCQARLKDGTLITLHPGREPDRLDLRPALVAHAAPSVDLRAALGDAATVRVYLGVPKLKLGSANVAPGDEAGKHRFQVDVRSVPDENLGGQDQEIQLRVLNVQLLLSTQELSGFEVVPIAQIQRAGTENAAPQLDKTYIPPVLATDAWQELDRGIVRAIYDIIGRNIESLSKQVLSRTVTLASQDPNDAQLMLMLHVLNGAYTTLGVLAFARGVHPLLAYTELCRIVGQLAIFGPQRQPPTIPHYDHDDLHGIFSYIKLQIETALGWIPIVPWIPRDFTGDGTNRMQVKIERDWFNSNWEWYIGVSRDTLTEAECKKLLLTDLVWKLGSADSVDELFVKNMAGLELFAQDKPQELPVYKNWTFFNVKRQGVVWKQVVSSGTLAMRFKETLVLNRNELQGKKALEVFVNQRRASLRFTLFAISKVPR